MADRTFQLVVPPCTVRFFEAGEDCVDALPGDFLLVHHPTVLDELIEIGQDIEKIREPALEGYTWCTHTAYLADGVTVSEMGPRGYERRPLVNYKHHLYAVVSFAASPRQRQASNDFNDACSDLKYGWNEYAPLILEAVEHDTFAGSWGDNIICSVHVTLLAAAQGLFPDRWASQVYPALLAFWTGAQHA